MPTQLDPKGQTLRWQTALRGRGISSPIVVDGRVIIRSESFPFCFGMPNGKAESSRAMPTPHVLVSAPDAVQTHARATRRYLLAGCCSAGFANSATSLATSSGDTCSW